MCSHITWDYMHVIVNASSGAVEINVVASAAHLNTVWSVRQIWVFWAVGVVFQKKKGTKE